MSEKLTPKREKEIKERYGRSNLEVWDMEEDGGGSRFSEEEVREAFNEIALLLSPKDKEFLVPLMWQLTKPCPYYPHG